MLNYVEYGKENKYDDDIFFQKYLSLIHISEPTRRYCVSRMPSSA